MLEGTVPIQGGEIGLLGQAVLGIVTGILTSVLIFGAKHLFTSWFLPFWRQQRYQGVDIEGQWYGEGADDEGKSEITLTLTQSAHDVGGDVRITFVGPDKAFELRFNVVGHIWEGFVSMNFLPADRRLTSYSAGLLKITEGGLSLTGVMAYRHSTSEVVETIRLYLTRTPPTQARRENLNRAQSAGRELSRRESNQVDPSGFVDPNVR